MRLHFEVKLLVRSQRHGRPLEVDRWAGGSLSMTATPTEDGVAWRLERPLDDPWTLRWYPALDEVKLGAAIAVAEPEGHPYGALAESLTTRARALHAEWWDGLDRVSETLDAAPAWVERANGFWLEVHRRETDDRDELPAAPVYPFHVLGDPTARFEFVVNGDGAVPRDSIDQTMSDPWLPDGWARWCRGERPTGYGYWESKRPDWEPRTYETMAEVLSLLAWSPLPDGVGSAASVRALGAYETGSDDVVQALARTLATLERHLEGRLDWNGDLRLRATVSREAGGVIAVTARSGESRIRSAPEIRVRLWRHTRFDTAEGRVTADELQVHAADAGGRIRAWVRVGYLPLDSGPSESGNPTTN